MPSWRPIRSRAAGRTASSCSSTGARPASRTLNRPWRARSSLRRRCSAWVRCRLAVSTSSRRRLSAWADSASRWNSASAGSSRPRASSAADEAVVSRAGRKRLIQPSAVTGRKPGPPPAGSPVPNSAAPPAGQETQTTPRRVASTLSRTTPVSSPAVRNRSGRGRGVTLRAIAAAKSTIQASTCPASGSAARGSANAARGTRRSSAPGSPLAMHTSETPSSRAIPNSIRPGRTRRSCW